MQAYDAKDMGRSFRTVRNNTIQIAEEIPEEKYDFRPAEGARSVAETLRHIAVSTNIATMIHGERHTQLTMAMFGDVMAKQIAAEAELKTKSDILKALREKGDAFAAFLEGMSDEALAEQVRFAAESNMPPKTRFEMLLSPKEHEMHHRGQLMVIERMLGITPHLTRAMQERMAAFHQRQTVGAQSA